MLADRAIHLNGTMTIGQLRRTNDERNESIVLMNTLFSTVEIIPVSNSHTLCSIWLSMPAQLRDNLPVQASLGPAPSNPY